MDFMKKGDQLDFSKTKTTVIKGNLNWDANPVAQTNNQQFDLDIVIAVLGENGKLLSDGSLCYFNQKVIEGVSIPTDNRDGKGENDEYFTLVKDSLNKQAKTVEVFVVIHNAASRSQCMSMMINGAFVIKDDSTGDQLGAWRLQDYGRDTAIHIATIDVGGDAFVLHTQGVSQKFEISDIYHLFKK